MEVGSPDLTRFLPHNAKNFLYAFIPFLLPGARVDNLPEIPVLRCLPGGVLTLGLIFERKLRCVCPAVPALDVQAPAALLLDAPYAAAAGAVLQVDLGKMIHVLSSYRLFARLTIVYH